MPRKRITRKEQLRNPKYWGLILYKHHLCWASGDGWFMGAPEWLKYLIVTVWNHTTCFLMGHDICGPWDFEGKHIKKFCSACSKEWRS